MKPIAIFYHCLFALGEPPKFLPNASAIIKDQMYALASSGLLHAATEFHVGLNGGAESELLAQRIIPPKASIVYHGLQSRAENLTLVMLEKWVPAHPDWHVLYFHSKGCSHEAGTDYEKFAARWRRCMMKHCVENWKTAVAALAESEAVGAHWLTGMGHDKSQHYFAGNFWWATSDFLATVPSIYKRDRIKESGIDALESRYEAEVWIGNGVLPKMKDLETTHGFAACP